MIFTHFFAALGLACVSEALATSSVRAVPQTDAQPDIRFATQDVDIILQVNKPLSEATVEVRTKDEIVGHSCTTSLTSGAFEDTPISFTVNEKGAGNLTIGTKSYVVHDNLEISGGISCGSITSASEIVINCKAPISSALKLTPLRKRDLQECFSHGPLELEGVMRGLQCPATMPIEVFPIEPINGAGINFTEYVAGSIDKRQGACGVWSRVTNKVGDGNPHQNPLHIQLSEPMECGQGPCGISHSMVTSFSIAFSASATPFQWISGGFAVQMTVETGNAWTCEGTPGQFFAVWKKVAQTAYTVQNFDFNQCTGNHQAGGPYVMWSPNVDNRGGNYYCVYGRDYVRWLGDRWLDTTPVRGGPP